MAQYDEQPLPLAASPWATWSLVSVNILLFLVDPGTLAPHLTLSSDAQFWSPYFLLTFITSMFIHSGWGHLLGNMMILFSAGKEVELALGVIRFLILYFAAGIFGGIAFIAINQDSSTYLLGASGAISGALIACAIINPCARIWVSLGRQPVPVRVYWFIGAWIPIQIYFFAALPHYGGIAYEAHLGGAVSGIALLLLLKPANITLLKCRDTGRDEFLAALLGAVPILVFFALLIAVLLITR